MVALAVFAKAPVPGRVKTRLIPPLTPVEAARIARACLEESLRRFVPAAEGATASLYLDGDVDDSLLALCGSLDVPVVPQSVGDLGARLRSAFRAARSGGASKVLAIGSDSPTLDPARIREAIEALDTSDIVLGPTEDGGYYLIGTRRDADGIFDGIPWSTPNVARATLARAAALGLSVQQLPAWYDLDDVASLRRARDDAGDQVSALTRTIDSVLTARTRTSASSRSSC